jgi:hypothetical protein
VKEAFIEHDNKENVPSQMISECKIKLMKIIAKRTNTKFLLWVIII